MTPLAGPELRDWAATSTVDSLSVLVAHKALKQHLAHSWPTAECQLELSRVTRLTAECGSAQDLDLHTVTCMGLCA